MTPRIRRALLVLVVFSRTCLGLDITTVDGVTYRKCEVTQVEPESLVFNHQDGTARIGYYNLPPAVQTKYFEAAKVEAHRRESFAAARQSEELQAADWHRRENATAEEKRHDEDDRRRAEQDAKDKAESKKRSVEQAETTKFACGAVLAVLLAWIALRYWQLSITAAGAAVAIYFFFVYDTTVTTQSTRIEGIGMIPAMTTHNLGLLQNRQLGCIGGIVLFFAGVLITLTRRPAD